MPQIDDDVIYNVVQVANGATWIGTDSLGKTVQFSFEGFVEALNGVLDVLYFQKATKSGQTVFCNMPGVDESLAPTINGGDPCIAVITTFPASTDADVYKLLKINIR